MDTTFDRIELERRTEDLYQAFADYPLADRIDHCPHCELDEAERQLHARPLSELTWRELGPFAFRAMATFGDLADLKHFLPRLLELYAADHVGAPHSLFMFFGKLDAAAWTTWPPGEVAAIRAFVEAWKRLAAARAHESDSDAWELGELIGALSVL
jgi:hypothetical protein